MLRKAVGTVCVFWGIGLLLIGCAKQKDPPLMVTWRYGALGK